jgi:hypothetical protein
MQRMLTAGRAWRRDKSDYRFELRRCEAARRAGASMFGQDCCRGKSQQPLRMFGRLIVRGTRDQSAAFVRKRVRVHSVASGMFRPKQSEARSSVASTCSKFWTWKHTAMCCPARSGEGRLETPSIHQAHRARHCFVCCGTVGRGRTRPLVPERPPHLKWT